MGTVDFNFHRAAESRRTRPHPPTPWYGSVRTRDAHQKREHAMATEVSR